MAVKPIGLVAIVIILLLIRTVTTILVSIIYVVEGHFLPITTNEIWAMRR